MIPLYFGAVWSDDHTIEIKAYYKKGKNWYGGKDGKCVL